MSTSLFILRSVVAPLSILAVCYLYPAHLKLSHVPSAKSSANQEQVRLAISPDAVRQREVVYLLLLFLWRFILQKVGLRKKLQPRHVGTGTGEEYIIGGPVNQVEMPLQRSLQSAVKDYLKAIGLSATDVLGETQFAFFFCAITTPTLLALLASKTCPVQPLGTVNVRNTFAVFDVAACRRLISQKQDDTGTADKDSSATIVARLDTKARKVKRGWEMDFIIDILAEKTSDGQGPIFTQTFTFLQFDRHRDTAAQAAPVTTTEDPLDAPATSMSLSLAPNDPFLWAGVTKDYNPIHISYYAARLFGQPSRIAHGNQVAAKALAELAKLETGNFLDKAKGEDSVGLQLSVAFKRPVRIPSKMEIACKQGKGKYSISVEKEGKTFVEIVVNQRGMTTTARQ